MTGLSESLCYIRPYLGSSHIQIADGNHLIIDKVGDINSSFCDVFVSPALSTNLISIGRLVDNDCDVHFSRNGCLV